MQIKTRAAVTLIWLSAGSGISFITNMILAKVMGAVEYGQFNLYLAYSVTWALLLNFGMGHYVPVTINENNKHDFSRILVTVLYCFLLVSPLFLTALHYYFDIPFSANVCILLMSFSGVVFALLKAFNVAVKQAHWGEFNFNFLPRFLFLAVYLGSFLFVDIKSDVVLYTYTLINMLVAVVFLPRIISGWTADFAIVRYSFIFNLIVLTYGLVSPVARILQGNLFGAFEVGVLSVTITLGNVISLFAESLVMTVKPEFVSNYKSNNYHRIKELYHTFTHVNAVIILPVVLFLAINGQRILNLLGDDYSLGYVTFVLVLLSQSINSFFGPNGNLISLTGGERNELITGISKVVITIGVTLALYQYPWGIGVALVAAELATNCFKSWIVYQRFRFFPLAFSSVLPLFLLIPLLAAAFYFAETLASLFVWGSVNVLLIALFILVSLFIDGKTRKMILELVSRSIRYVRNS